MFGIAYIVNYPSSTTKFRQFKSLIKDLLHDQRNVRSQCNTIRNETYCRIFFAKQFNVAFNFCLNFDAGFLHCNNLSHLHIPTFPFIPSMSADFATRFSLEASMASLQFGKVFPAAEPGFFYRGMEVHAYHVQEVEGSYSCGRPMKRIG